jgi:hypothetical protein
VLLDRLQKHLLARGGAEVGVVSRDDYARKLAGILGNAFYVHRASDVLSTVTYEDADFRHGHPLRTRLALMRTIPELKFYSSRSPESSGERENNLTIASGIAFLSLFGVRLALGCRSVPFRFRPSRPRAPEAVVAAEAAVGTHG